MQCVQQDAPMRGVSDATPPTLALHLVVAVFIQCQTNNTPADSLLKHTCMHLAAKKTKSISCTSRTYPSKWLESIVLQHLWSFVCQSQHALACSGSVVRTHRAWPHDCHHISKELGCCQLRLTPHHNTNTYQTHTGVRPPANRESAQRWPLLFWVPVVMQPP